MEFAFGGLKDGPVLLGLRQKGRFDRIVDLSECRILSSDAGRLLAAVRCWAESEKIPTYHLKSHKGFLRYLVVREGKNTGERMVHLVTAAGEAPKESFLAALDGSGVRVDTAVWSVNPDLSDVARGVVKAVWRGSGAITETLEGKPYVVTPDGFFQTNTRAAERLYGVVREWAGAGETLLDLYCGAGTIGLFCAANFRRVVGVETHAASVESARENARRQGDERVEFHALDVAGAVKEPWFAALWDDPGTVAVLDPPRPGLTPDLRRLLMDRPPARWIYVSCNPKALAADLAVLSDVFAVQSVQSVDLFPHTPHVETALLLRRRGGV
jgi:23S rRNA (uracil1939-C5)-methyltransferase